MKKIKNVLIVFTAIAYAFSVGACATAPKRVYPISQTVEEGRDCGYYKDYMITLNNKENDLVRHQKELYKNDAIFLGLSIGLGVLLLPFALFALGIDGDDQKTHDLAKVRGEQDAVKRILNKKNCSG